MLQRLKFLKYDRPALTLVLIGLGLITLAVLIPVITMIVFTVRLQNAANDIGIIGGINASTIVSLSFHRCGAYCILAAVLGVLFLVAAAITYFVAHWKRTLIILGVILCLILFTPFHVNYYDDGGTKDIMALTYRVVEWKRDVGETDADGNTIGITEYENTCVYFLPDNFKNIDELWEIKH